MTLDIEQHDGSAGNDPIRVIIVDEPATRGHVRASLDPADDILVVEEASGRHADRAVAQHMPDVVVIDLRDLDAEGLVMIERLSALEESPAIIALTAASGDPDMVGALKAGAIGCLPKSTPPEQLAGLVRAVAAGHTVLSLATTRRLLRSAIRRQADHDRRLALVGKLSERELEILAALGEGLTNARIARRLHLSKTTVKSYVSMVLEKLDCSNRTQACLLALEAGLCSGLAR